MVSFTYSLTNICRNELKQKVMQIKCSCCESTADYPLLKQLRNEYCTPIIPENNHEKKVEIDEEEEDDDEYDDLLDDNFLTEQEQERLNEVSIRKEREEIAKELGLMRHCEDSINHIEQIIKHEQAIVCHFYDSHSSACARIDLILEKFALKFIGTIFRRFPYISDDVKELQVKWQIPTSTPTIACFVSNQLVVATTELSQFGNRDEVYPDILEQYLHHAHVLTDDISAAIMANAKMNGSVVAADSDEDETEEDSGFVCTQPGCSRRFMHEHVQDSNASYLNTTSNEALADHVFTRC